MKKSIWLRLLALMLVAGLMVGCFAGCSGEDASSDEDDKKDKTEELRDDLIKYKYQGLLVYLGDEMSELEDGYSTNEDETMELSVLVMDPEDIERDFGEGIESPKDLVEAAKTVIPENDGEVIDSGKKNGVYYVHAKLSGNEGVVGLYYEDGYWWAVSIIIEDEDLVKTAIKYATLCEVTSAPNLKEEDIDRPNTLPTPGTSENQLPGDYDEPQPPVDEVVEHITLKVWAPGPVIDYWLADRMNAFEDAHPEYLITWEVSAVSEGDAGTYVCSDPSSAADVFLFANDQIGMLVQCDGLMRLGGEFRNQVLQDNTTTMVNSVTYTDGEIYGFPITCNTWVMYYDKRVFSESDIKSLDTMLSKGRVAFDISNGWYNGALFFGAGATLFGPMGNEGYEGINFRGPIGTAVAQKMLEMYHSGNLITEPGSAGLMMSGFADASFSGSWDYESLRNALGDDLGVAALPSFNVDGNTYQMKAFAGSKAVGVNGWIEDSDRAALAMKFASFLANAESQEMRMEYYGITPVHVDLLNSDALRNSPVAQAEMEVINNCSIVQPVISEMGKYWTPMGNFGNMIISGDATYDNVGELLQQVEDEINYT